MIPLSLYFAVAVVALVATAMWAILARETGIYITSGLSFVGYAWLAIGGGSVALVTDTQTVWLRSSVASLQVIALSLAVISLVVFSMRLMGAYPSPSNNAAESDRSNT